MERNSIDWNSVLFRASSAGKLMVEPQKKSETFSEATKGHLIDIYVSAKYGRNTDISNKYIEKGLLVEEDSITLYSRVKKMFFKKNERHLTNDFLKGTPDLFVGLDITEADMIIDLKSSWDLYTFFRVHTKEINKDYWWQLQTYMDLTGAKSAKLAYCLVNTPETIILDEERKLFYRMNAGTTENKLYQEACEELRRSMIYDDIPLNERVIEFEIQRDDEAIARLHKRVVECRNYLENLERKLHPSVLLATQEEEGVMMIEPINI